MNITDAGIERIGHNQYRALVRFPWQAELGPPRINGKPAPPFNSQFAAMHAATQCVLTWVNGNMRRQGDKLLCARSEADRVFGGEANG